jgi:hypothetical protein
VNTTDFKPLIIRRHCLNTYLRPSNPLIFTSLTYRIVSILEHRHTLKDPSQSEYATENRPDRDKPADKARGQRYVEELNILFVLDFYHHNRIFEFSQLREGTVQRISLISFLELKQYGTGKTSSRRCTTATQHRQPLQAASDGNTTHGQQPFLRVCPIWI